MPALNGKTFFGWFPLQFENVVDRILLVFQELTDRLPEKMTDEERDQTKFYMRVSLRTSFTEEQFTFLFYSLKDLVSEIGGLGGAISGTLGKFMVYIMMLFVVDMVMVIKQKYKQQKRLSNFTVIGYKLPFFKKIILSKINALKAELRG